MHYCLLCDSNINDFPYLQHDYHKYYDGDRKWIEYFYTKGHKPYDASSFIFGVYMQDIHRFVSGIEIAESDFVLFKGLHNYELAKPIIDKLKVFK